MLGCIGQVRISPQIGFTGNRAIAAGFNRTPGVAFGQVNDESTRKVNDALDILTKRYTDRAFEDAQGYAYSANINNAKLQTHILNILKGETGPFADRADAIEKYVLPKIPEYYAWKASQNL